MIDIESQNDILRLISSYLKKDITCYAFGGTAMMFYGYKAATKDIDLIFESEKDRELFIDAITQLGYKQKSLVNVYKEEQLKSKNGPLMFSRGEERFDLFVKNIFQTELGKDMIDRFYARHDFIMKDKTLTIKVLNKEDIILLKSVTDREKDFEDILTIVERESEIDWDLIIDEAVKQHRKGNKTILLDLEETLQRLKKYVFIPKKHFDRIYKHYR